MNIRHVRKSLGMTQVEFAKELSITQGSLSDYERGRTDVPPYIEKLIELYIQVHGVDGLIKHNSILRDKKTVLEEEIKKIDQELEQSEDSPSRRNSSNPLPGIEGA